MAKIEDINVKIYANFSFWSAIKMRVAGIRGLKEERQKENEELLKSLIKGLEKNKNGKCRK